MPRSLLAFATVMMFAPFAGAKPPALVVHSRSTGALIGEAKALAKLAGGPLADEFDDWLETTFGEDGLKGIDLSKPLVVYAPLTGVAAEAKLFAIVPITKEAEFLELLERLDRAATAEPNDKSLYRIGEDDDADVLYFRFHHGCAYFVLYGAAKDLDAKTLPDAKDLLNAGDPALVTATVRPGSTDAAFRKSALEALAQAIEELGAFPFLPPATAKVLGEWGQSFEPLAKAVLADGESITVRLDREPGAKELSFEIAVTPKKGTALAKDIASRKLTANRFSGLATWPDAAAVLLLQQPNWNDEARKVLGDSLKVLGAEFAGLYGKELEAGLIALLDGMIPPAKAGALDFGAILTAPDKSGFGGAAFGLSHSDPAALLTALAAWAKKPPEEFGESRDEFAKALKLNAAKGGELAIHTVALKAFLPDNLKELFGTDALLAVAFDKDALYVAFGTGAVELLRRLPGLKPGEASAVDLRVNPKKLAGWPKVDLDGIGDLVRDTLGEVDKLTPVVRLTIGGTGELKIRATLSVPIARIARKLFEFLDSVVPNYPR